MASKRVWMASIQERFINSDAEAAYYKMKRDCGITLSRILQQDKLSYPISNLFSQTTLMFTLTLSFPFHSNILFEFFANLIINSSRTILSSRVFCIDIEITKEDLARYLFITNTGLSAHTISIDSGFRWNHINEVIRNTKLHEHHHSVNGLVQNARIIQHVLRHTILPKAGDRTNITPLHSLVTYYCMTNTPFDVADLLIRYIKNISSVREPRFKKKQNLALGHIIAYILQNKYSLGNTEEPDHHPSLFSDHSFHTLFGGKKHKQPIDEEEVEEEEAAPPQGESSRPPPQSWEYVTDSLARLELRLEQHIETENARWQQWEAQQQDNANRWIQWEQQQEENRAWFQAQFDSLGGRRPPGEGPPDF